MSFLNETSRDPPSQLTVADTDSVAVMVTLLTGESAFAELPVVMAGLTSRPGGALCHSVTYEEG